MEEKLSQKYYVHKTAVVDEGALIGEGTKVWHFSHIMAGAKIGKNCVVGQNVYVGNVEIGDRVKLQNNVSVYDGVKIEDEVFVGPSAVFTNDKYPRAVGEWKISPTVVKRGASLGANCTVVCGVTIGEGAMIGAGAVVTRDVPAGELWAGNPAKRLRRLGRRRPNEAESAASARISGEELRW